jgi:hypothetical protein
MVQKIGKCLLLFPILMLLILGCPSEAGGDECVCAEEDCAQFIQECPVCDGELFDKYFVPLEIVEQTGTCTSWEGGGSWYLQNATVYSEGNALHIDGNGTLLCSGLVGFHENKNDTFIIYIRSVQYWQECSCPSPHHFHATIMGFKNSHKPITHFKVYAGDGTLINEGEINEIGEGGD